MDAFGVSITKGITLKEKIFKYAILCGVWFGLFQVIMPLIGYYLGSLVLQYIDTFDHFVIFAILAFLGVKMIISATKQSKLKSSEFAKEELTPTAFESDFRFITMLLLALATSIDALSTGLVISSEGIDIWLAIMFIGGITFLMCIGGVYLGKLVGDKFRSKAEIVAGIILLLVGLYILLKHLIGF
jgi:putative Mn2+ efflux pump MntP